jgi:uncharacterized protein YegP (UPF0339 family)
MEDAKDAQCQIQRDDRGLWQWYLLTADGRNIARSGNGYRDLGQCKQDVEFVQASADIPVEVI